MVQYGRSSRSSWTKFIWSSFGRTVMGKAIWEDLIKARLGEGFQIGNVSLYIVKKGYSYLCMWMSSNWLERNNILIRWGKYSTKKLIWENQHHSLISTQRQGEKKQRYCRQLQSHVWITNFRGWNWNTTILGKYSYFFVVLRYGRSSQEMYGTILWVGKQNDSTTQQSIDSMYRWPSLQRRRIGSRGRIVKSMLSICCEMLVLGTHWTTWYSLVSEQTCTINH